MKCAAVCAVLICILNVHVQGQARTSVNRCLCQGPLANMVGLQRIHKVEVYPASPSCKNVEIVVTLKNGAGQKCLIPDSKFAQNIIKKSIQQGSE